MAQVLRRAASLALVTAVWCWLMSALHGIWSFGIVLGYLEGGRIPLFPTFPVTYGSFFISSIGAFALPFLIVFTACILVPRRFAVIIVVLGWMIGAWIGASNTAFTFQIDFGTTWRSWESVYELYYHPLFTPVWLVLGVAGAISLTRPLRKRA